MSALTATASMAPQSLDTQHTDMIHDTTLDYYGTRLATASSDRTVKIFNITPTAPATLVATLTGHTGPVWSADWSHPRFGTLIASSSFDGTVLIHREVSPNKYALIYKHTSQGNTTEGSSSSINHVKFAPAETGLKLAACSADGVVCVLTHNPDDTWSTATFKDCALGVNSLTWAPFIANTPPRLCTGGCDARIRLWSLQGENGADGWVEDRLLGNGGHRDWVRDVAWSPGGSVGSDLIASCGEDGQVLLWTRADDVYNPQLMHQFDGPVWRVSWSVTGNVLAVSSGESDVTLWKKQLAGEWTRVVDVDDPANQLSAVGEDGAM